MKENNAEKEIAQCNEEQEFTSKMAELYKKEEDKKYLDLTDQVRLLIPLKYSSIFPGKNVVEQMFAVTRLPHVHSVVGLPDIHLGYAFPIGSVVGASIVVPEGVGNDINCGVRMVRTRSNYRDVDMAEVARQLFDAIPSGIGGDTVNTIIDEIVNALNKGVADTQNRRAAFTDMKLINEVCNEGVDFLVKHGIVSDERDRIERGGRFPSDSRMLSQKAKAKGLKQLGSLGAGNHFLEIQRVAEVYDNDADFAVDELVFMIHTGSRGLGFEVCESATQVAASTRCITESEIGNESHDIQAVRKSIGLCSASISASGSSENLSYFEAHESEDYLLEMGCAANYAFCNRAIISKKVEEVLGQWNVKCELVYDVGHNSLIRENIDGRECFVHRKGAARALPPNHPELRCNREKGQPIPIGGSMGTSSYLLYAQDTAKSLFSSPHGAGRKISRHKARKLITMEQLRQVMGDIILMSKSEKGAIEEAPMVYKDIDDVVDAAVELGLVKKAVKLEPLAVIKG
ncbi:hypothetical protein VCUG_02559 [Vavraia culicis subsp. floridensis]|uniref:3'-phosphate/5'-hydroxy nucleic acid ligase n=1 Tax=Vavraia culicis (isolate floridensis) TaxID=948595 RepID=L2GQM9_VAVCU|nr:uncharacterized protein VCUG_02559 [Vavraia culicis subsp. floridensis]ELA45951.1 hypothetical protein VCUG_02559 [Vavraia culicis subsp. floridensis]